MRLLLFIAVLVCSFVPVDVHADTNAVETSWLQWHDQKRNREIPVKIYLPAKLTNPAPVIVFSHGLGGTREHYQYLGEHWASHGYISVHVQHIGSDDSVLRGAARPMQALRGASAALTNSINRPLDISFAIDELTRLNADTNSALYHKLDLAKIGVAGHSYGAFTTLAIAGQLLGPKETSFQDKRVKAAIAMSSPVSPGTTNKNFRSITIPIFHLTGTADSSPIGNTKPQDRRLPFDWITNAPENLVTFKDADHIVFSGNKRGVRNAERDERQHRFILESTTAFWDAYLRNDAKAKQWLSGGDFKKELGDEGVFEQKQVK